MESIGAEVGQKMRSAIKAKLLELNYDELPDYIMVMVANKRSKSQMNEDLNLFLSTKTSTFVDWLHIVLKKLKEVTVTNPEVYKKVVKRKMSAADLPDVKVKKEKKEYILQKAKNEDDIQTKSLTDNLPVSANQLSGHRKVTVVSETRTINAVLDDNFDIPLLSEVSMSNEQGLEEIEKKIKSVKSRLGLLVESDIEEELPEDSAHAARIYPERTSPSKATDNTNSNSAEQYKTITDSSNGDKRHEHKRITFDLDDDVCSKKPSILDRLGKRQDNLATNSLRTRISLSEFQKEEERFLQYPKNNSDEDRGRQTERDWRHRKDRRAEKGRRDREGRSGFSRERRRDDSRDRRRDRSSESKADSWKEGILSRLGVMSKVSLPPKEPEESEPEDELKTREVRSMVQVKPRIIPSGTPQPNKNLLLKAVAEAQKSVAQTPKVGSHLMSELFTSRYAETGKEKSSEDVPFFRKFSQTEKTKLKNLILAQATQRNKQNGGDSSKGEEEEEYIPKPIKSVPKETPNYVPSSRHPDDDSEETEEEVKHQFIVTLDGIEKEENSTSESKPSIKSRLDQQPSAPPASKPSIKSRLDGRKSPSPIIFDKVTTKVNSKSNIPDRLPIVHPPLSVKNKERCKYWPGCRQGDKCEFVHPSTNCEMFPHCKFGDKCLYLHPACKFGSSCTKRDCLYSHVISTKAIGKAMTSSRIGSSGLPVKVSVATLQNCKYYPNCTNTSCPFYHPKPCKFGKYCKNQSDCSFSHAFASNKSSLIWRSKLSKENHPDINKRKDAHKKFQEINEAYRVLSKPESRRLYDLGFSTTGAPPRRTRVYYKEEFGSDPWRDPSFYTNRDRTRDAYYESKSYYGIKGLQILAIRHSFTFKREELIRQSKEAEETLKKVREVAATNGNELQIELLKSHFEKSGTFK
ncbi:hypothetical protein NQ318_009887 [Aromia moschata]|uniref:Zinc finger CCCH domain-containing protein 14 n=1 Tax=Aromia moschata TaxID=1265417 RepID=A0AAV8Y1W7_9CUCU|nr:hypothetical protein NQ318_009887 [Aromia moschata]